MLLAQAKLAITLQLCQILHQQQISNMRSYTRSEIIKNLSIYLLDVKSVNFEFVECRFI